MLEKPELRDEQLLACLREAYRLPVTQVAFLPLGADPNTAVYRAVATDGVAYFVKLRSGDFNETAVTLPKALYDQGIAPVIAPLATSAGQLWAELAGFVVVVYPFVEGQNGYALDLSERHWRELGAALHGMHTAVLPPALVSSIPPETFDPHARQMVRSFLAQLADIASVDPIAGELAAFLREHYDQVLALVERAEQLALVLQAQPLALVVCHADLHAGNIMIDVHDRLYIVDWDTAIRAPKECDLMFVGGALGFSGHTPQQEAALFYQGYGSATIDSNALAYYRYERIIQDIAVYCEQLFSTSAGGDDRAQALYYLKWNFLAGNTIDRAYAADPSKSLL